MKIQLVDNDYHPSVEELAKEIWDLDAEHQLKLLMCLAKISNPYYISMQLQYMMDEKHEHSELYGRTIDDFVNLITEYLSDY